MYVYACMYLPSAYVCILALASLGLLLLRPSGKTSTLIDDYDLW